MQKAGLYIHIPFCEKKCGYCDFYSITQIERIDEFVDALLAEIRLAAPLYRNLSVDTIFFGGGTPTILSTTQIHKIWNQLHQYFDIAPDGEFSIEANPGTLDEQKLKNLRKTGFNRLSMGVQSFQEEDLKFLGRIHTTAEILENFQAARQAGFNNINIDLMTAFPGLSENRFRDTLEKAVSLKPEHISCYTLIFEPKTPFYARMEKGELSPLDDESEAGFYEIANQQLSDSGYQPYEVSNFAVDTKRRCRHNLKYWNHEPCLGFGPSAHSFMDNRRWWNFRPLNKYLQSVGEHQIPVAESETLDSDKLEFEYIFLHLRLREGVNLLDFQKRFQKNFIQKYSRKLKSFMDDGLLQQIGDQISLTHRGWLLADEVAGAF